MAAHQLKSREILKPLAAANAQILKGALSYGPLVTEKGGSYMEAEEQTEGQWLWSCQRRLPGQTVLAKNLSYKETLAYLDRSLADTSEQLDLIAQGDGSALAATQPHRGVLIQVASSDWVLDVVERSYPRHRKLLEIVGEEPSSDICLSHGDPLLRNIVFDKERSYLVDYEGLFPLPRDRDWTHMVSYLALYRRGQELLGCSELIFEYARHQLPGWGQDEWRRACAFHILREAAMWRNRDSDDRQDSYLGQVEALIG